MRKNKSKKSSCIKISGNNKFSVKEFLDNPDNFLKPKEHPKYYWGLTVADLQEISTLLSRLQRPAIREKLEPFLQTASKQSQNLLIKQNRKFNERLAGLRNRISDEISRKMWENSALDKLPTSRKKRPL